jgi:hypothetical protein
MNQNEDAPRVNWLLALVGGVAGGVAGYFLFFLLLKLGLYGIVLPGAGIGLGCGLLSRGKSNTLAAVCGVAGAALGLFTQWQVTLPIMSLGFFLTHLRELPAVAVILIGAGTLFAFWFGRGHERPPRRREPMAADRPETGAN